MNAKEILLALAIKHQGEWNAMYEDIKNKTYVSKEEIEQAKELLAKNGINYLTMLDEDYPDYLKSSYKPPFVLFYKGDINLIKDTIENVCFIGSKDFDLYTRGALDKVLEHLETYDNVVVGMSEVGNYVAINAMEQNKKVVAFTSGSINENYPKGSAKLTDAIVEKGGLVLSEIFKTEQPIESSDFVGKYRLMASVSQRVVVGNLTKNSANNMVITYALQNGKDIDVIPQPFDSNYINNKLISEGANIIYYE